MDLYVVKQKINTFELTRSVAAALIGLCALRYSWVQGPWLLPLLFICIPHINKGRIYSQRATAPLTGEVVFSLVVLYDRLKPHSS